MLAGQRGLCQLWLLSRGEKKRQAGEWGLFQPAIALARHKLGPPSVKRRNNPGRIKTANLPPIFCFASNSVILMDSFVAVETLSSCSILFNLLFSSLRSSFPPSYTDGALWSAIILFSNSSSCFLAASRFSSWSVNSSTFFCSSPSGSYLVAPQLWQREPRRRWIR